MLGSGFEFDFTSPKSKLQQVKGISLLAIEDLFNLLQNEYIKIRNKEQMNYSFKIEISYIEVYNEQIRDLLRDDQQHNLIILEEPNIGTVIPGLK